jgi:hypothetical protein
VEGARRDSARAEGAKAAAQLASRAGSERECHHPTGRVDTGRDPVGDAVRYGTRLACAGSGQEADRAQEGFGRDALLVIKTREK